MKKKEGGNHSSKATPFNDSTSVVFDVIYITSVVDFLKKYKREKVDNRNIVISPTSSGKLLVRFRLSSFVYHLV